ncbi:MAG: hypothetical protein O3A82_04590 [Verrucomicrobia bacterium]|jgi:hypothetical protein|nr:hypothetical protein [Verrucomicrobiota bacterium]MDA0723584.1 hypothetical protein [Verrucomicrobiota bacterium]MDA1046190.1 hypothetical protein [Verrucomicrobiota bacterium]
MKYDEPDKDEEDDWGQPPAPKTPENLAKAHKAQLILAVVAGIGIILPFLLLFLIYGPSSCGLSV